MVADGTVLLSSKEAHRLFELVIGGQKLIILIIVILGIIILWKLNKIEKAKKEIIRDELKQMLKDIINEEK